MPIDTCRLEPLVSSLEHDVLFAMSLGSKELFHSNLLAFFVRNYRVVGDAVTGLAGEQAIQVHREKNHTDLLVEADGVPRVVIENKVFDLPDDEQLFKLAEEYPSPGTRLVLLSLTPPNWEDRTLPVPGATGRAWTYQSYGDLAERIRRTLPDGIEPSSYEGLTLERWLNLVGQLENLAVLTGHPDEGEPLDLDPHVAPILRHARLDSAVQKMRFQHVAGLLRTRGLAGVTVGFSRASALMQWYVADHDGLWWGWQFQGGQFRLVLIVPDDHVGYGGKQHREIREATARQHRAFFDFGSFLAGRPEMPENPDAFCGYVPNFVYRYVSFPKATVAEITDLCLELSQHARAHATRLSGS